jgi:hypothetical protein
MNIFILSILPDEAAEQHCDKHVIKMILETTQLLYHCLAFFNEENWGVTLEFQLKTNKTLIEMQENGQKVNLKPYTSGKGHMNHPCSKWVRESVQNYKWLCQLGMSLCKEKMIRWPKNKQHASLGHLEVLEQNIPKLLPNIGLTKFALAMPEEYKRDDSIDSYRTYYVNDKQHILKWTNRQTPNWVH